MEWGMNGFVWNHRGRLSGSSGCALDSCTRRNATSLGCGVKWVQSHGESPLLLRNVLRRAFPILLGVPETGVMAGDPLGYRPRSQSLELGLLFISSITPCTQAVREVKTLQGKVAPIIFKNNTIQKYHQQFRGWFHFFYIFHLCCLSSLLSSALPALFPLKEFQWLDSFTFTLTNPRDCGAKKSYKLLCSRLTAGVSSCLKSPSELKSWQFFARHCSVLK